MMKIKILDFLFGPIGKPCSGGFWMIISLILTLYVCLLIKLFGILIDIENKNFRELDEVYQNNRILFIEGGKAILLNRELTYEINKIKQEQKKHGQKF